MIGDIMDEDEIVVSDKEFRDWCPPSILRDLDRKDNLGGTRLNSASRAIKALPTKGDGCQS